VYIHTQTHLIYINKHFMHMDILMTYTRIHISIYVCTYRTQSHTHNHHHQASSTTAKTGARRRRRSFSLPFVLFFTPKNSENGGPAVPCVFGPCSLLNTHTHTHTHTHTCSKGSFPREGPLIHTHTRTHTHKHKQTVSLSRSLSRSLFLWLSRSLSFSLSQVTNRIFELTKTIDSIKSAEDFPAIDIDTVGVTEVKGSDGKTVKVEVSALCRKYSHQSVCVVKVLVPLCSSVCSKGTSALV